MPILKTLFKGKEKYLKFQLMKSVKKVSVSHSVMSDSVWPHRWQPTRLRRPWDSPGKNTGVGCHFLLQCMKVKVKVKSLSHVWLLATPWTAAHQAPPSMGFSRQEYWNGFPFSSPVFLPYVGLNLGLPCCRQTLYHLSHQEALFIESHSVNI